MHNIPINHFFDRFTHSADVLDAYARLERGRLSLDEFARIFARGGFADAEHVTPALIRDILAFVGNPHGRPRAEMLHAVDQLRAGGVKVALLTNNWYVDEPTHAIDEASRRSLILVEADRFDVVVESCRVNMRKPETAIYELVLQRLNVRGDEAVFLDDLKENIAGAEQLGIHTIHVRNDAADGPSDHIDSAAALRLVARMTHVDLGVPGCRTRFDFICRHRARAR